MTRAMRWFMVAVIIGCLGGCQQELYSGLDENEANQIVALLIDAGIGASKENIENRDGAAAWQVSVDSGEMSAALNMLSAHGLPRRRLASLGDVFQQRGLVATPAEERVRYIYGISQELARTLENVDGVVVARVQVVIPENDPLSEKVKPSSAAVYLKYQPGVDLRAMSPMVKDLVAHSIEGLSYDNVSLFLQADTAASQRAKYSGGDYLANKMMLRSPFALSALVLLLLTLGVVTLIGARRGVFGARIANSVGARPGPSVPRNE